MDKIELMTKDVTALFAWRDEHVDLVRRMPAPLKAVEILFVETGYRIVGIRSGASLKLTLSHGYEKLGSKDLTVAGPNLVEKKSRLMKVTRDQFQSAIAAYCALMALMTYGNSEIEPEEVEPRQQVRRSAAASTKPRRKTTRRVTYIIRNSGSSLSVAPRGSHAKPSGIFNVRGHWRHYKSGKVVWIAEYKKGTGKKKSKTYKVGLKGAKE